jgi:GNAT superfamily N-acetyltransferase
LWDGYNAFFTDQAARGRGVGRALITAVYREAANAGSPRVYWHTHETNATARRLYEAIAERSGFIVYRKQLARARHRSFVGVAGHNR